MTHSAADNMNLSSFNFFWWAPYFLKFFHCYKSDASAIQGHPRSLTLVYQSKARMWIPISPS